MKDLTRERYAQATGQHKEKVYHIALKGWQVPILHGLIALAADHPGVKKCGWPIEQLITQVRWWCKEKYKEWGFTPEEVEYLDKMSQDAWRRITEE